MEEKRQEYLPDFAALHKYFSKKSTMEILGVDRDECAHSMFLGWFFENAVTGKVATSLLVSLLQSKINISANIINDVKVVLEDFVEVKGYHGRVDIVMDVTYSKTKHLHIVIENKIDSLEHKMGFGKKSEDAENAMWQTEGYYEYYSKKYTPCAFVFLTRPSSQITLPNDNEGYKQGPQCSNFEWITYQDILDKILVPLRETLSKESKERVRINDYIRCLGINSTQDNLIAVSEELHELADKVWDNETNRALFERLKQKDAGLNAFWETNKCLIQPLFKVLRYLHPDIDAITEIDKVVNGKDTTKYDLCYEGREYKNLSKNGLVKKTVELYINTCSNDIETVRMAFPSKLRMLNKGTGADPNSLSNQVVIQNSSRPNKWALLEGKLNWYVNQTGWDGKVMMNYFIEHAKTLLPGLQTHEVVPNEEDSYE